MEAVTLFLFASGMGVMFGWQPMPDGSPRYEYVVQLEPELVETLKEGQSIPISSDIPEDIRPIGRIRIVVGRGPLPRQQLTTRFKPWPEATARTGILETQHTTPSVDSNGTGRYGPPTSQPILPPGNTPPASNQRLAQAPQNTVLPGQNLGNQKSPILPPSNNPGLAGSLQNATQQFGNQIQNVGDSVRADAQQLFGAAGNGIVSGALERVGNAVGRVGQGVQQGTQPLVQAAEQTGQQLRNTVEGLGQRTRAAVGQFGQPLRERPPLSANQSTPTSILPPGTAPPQQPLAGGQHDHNAHGGTPSPDNWQATAQNNLQPGTPGPPPTPSQAILPSQSPASSFGASQAPWPSQIRKDNLSQNNLNQEANQVPSNPSVEGPRYLAPASRQPPLPLQAGGASSPPQSHEALDANWPATVSTPEIRRQMLDGPARAELQTASGQPVLSASSSPSPSAPAPGRMPRATSFAQNTPTRAAPDNVSSPNEGNRSVFPMILSWVLLSGSGLGNVYLFWSYMDVRSKYRGVVHNARSAR